MERAADQMTPYYKDSSVTIYHGDCREIAPTLGAFDAVISDPPYAETSLSWDRWPHGWPEILSKITASMWCFGSTRMFLERFQEFGDWKLSQDVVWEKHNGTNPSNDRFRRVHEMALHFYARAIPWAEIFKAPVFSHDARKRTVRRKQRPPQWGTIGEHRYTSEDGGPRMECSVIYARSCHGRALHPTEKPLAIVGPLIEYAVPAGGSFVEPFCGSGPGLEYAKQTGRRAVGIDADEQWCEVAAKRLTETLQLK